MTTASGQRILVVDDNEMNRDVLSRRLERQGFTIALAEDGEQALQMIRAERFSLVLLDIMMPKLNGYQVLEQVKADPATRETPIIVISALDELDSVVKCIELGAEDYLFKPFNPVLLKARVNACMEKQRLRQEAQSASSSGLPAAAAAAGEIMTAVAALSVDGTLGDTQRALVATIRTNAALLVGSAANVVE